MQHCNEKTNKRAHGDSRLRKLEDARRCPESKGTSVTLSRTKFKAHEKNLNTMETKVNKMNLNVSFK
jgi:hypothetical protein